MSISAIKAIDDVKKPRNIENTFTNVVPHWNSQILGKNVQIAGQHQAYRKPGCKDQAYVFLSQPLKLGWITTLEVIEVTADNWENMVYGVTSCNPANLKQSDLPVDPNDLLDRPEYWIVKYDSNFYQKKDIITFYTDKKGMVLVDKNGNRFTSFHVDPTQQIWLFFNIVGFVSGLRIINVRTSDEKKIPEIEKVKISDKDGRNSPLPESSSKEASSECVICCEEAVNCALYRCGHMCMCYKCALKMQKLGSKAICPICRKEILDVIKIYK